MLRFAENVRHHVLDDGRVPEMEDEKYLLNI